MPSRLHKGSFYALPQSPQLYKQLSMVAGFDRYMQIARCFRDEDLRADRQPEFTQIDLEMSFVDMEDVLEIGEGYMRRVFREMLGIELTTPLPRLTYREAMERYGSDKPDTRYGLELVGFDRHRARNRVRRVPRRSGSGRHRARHQCQGRGIQALAQGDGTSLTEFVRGIGAKGLAWARLNADGTAASFSKFLTTEQMQALCGKMQAETGDALLIVADANEVLALSVLGALRQEVAAKLDLVPKDRFDLLWITEFPFFEYDAETGEYVAMHHPFTAPMDECLDYLETDKARVRAKAYDLVLNGIELSSGSIRITDPKLQSRIFSLLGLSEEEAKEKFGFLLDAFRFGAPPHGGMGIGLDRLCMQLLGCASLRDVGRVPEGAERLRAHDRMPLSRGRNAACRIGACR